MISIKLSEEKTIPARRSLIPGDAEFPDNDAVIMIINFITIAHCLALKLFIVL